VRALLSSLAVLLVLPGAAGAATVSVEPFVERLPPGDDGFGSCSRYMMCPPDMVVFTAAAGEPNELTISEEPAAYPRTRFLVRDQAASVQAGAGCEQIDAMTVACTAATVGPVQLGDGDDRIATGRGYVSGGDGADALNVSAGLVDGDEGDDVVIGLQGGGGGGDDLLMVTSGRGDSGDDDLRCFPRKADFCHLDGGPGNDLVTGGESSDRLFGRAGDDVLRGSSGDDDLLGGRGDDRLIGGKGADELLGGRGADRVNCGGGRDRALADRRDRVTRCERVTHRRP
jgi:hypothetical protein